MGHRQNEVKNAARPIFKLRIIVAEQDLKISFYMQVLEPPPYSVASLGAGSGLPRVSPFWGDTIL